MSSRRRFLYGSLFAVLLALVLAAGYRLSSDLYRYAHNRALESLATISALKASELNLWLTEKTDPLAWTPSALLADDFERWQRRGGRQGAEADALRLRLDRLKAMSAEFTAVHLFGTDGRLHAASTGAPALGPLHHPAQQQAALSTGRPALVDFHLEPAAGSAEAVPALSILVPLFAGGSGAAAHAAGFLLFGIDPDVHLYPSLQRWPLASRSAENLLFRVEGDEIVYLSRLRHDLAAPLTLRQPLGDASQLAARSVKSDEPMLRGLDYRGVASVGVVSLVPGTDWYLLTKIDETDIFAEARRTAAMVAAVAGLLLFVLLLGSGLALHRLRSRDESARMTAELEQLRAKAALHTSEARYRAIVDSQMWEMCRWLPDTTLTFVNPAYAVAQGESLEALNGRRWLDFVTEDEREGIRKAIESMVAARRGRTYEHPVAAADGSQIWMAWTDTPIFDTTGAIVEFQSIGIDITLRKQAELALLVSEQRLQLALEAANGGLWDWDLPTGRAYLAPTYYTMLGYEPGDFPATFHGWTSLLHPDDLAPLMGELSAKTDHESDHFGLEFRLRAKDGGWRWMLGHGTVIDRDGDGLPSRVIGINLDVTERRAQEAERRVLFETIAASLNEIYMFDAATLRFRFVNQGALANLGYTLDQMRAMTPLDLKPDFDAAAFAAVLAPLTSGEKPVVTFRSHHRRADGSAYPVEAHLQFFRHGEDAYFLAIIQDIGERQAAEAALHESEARFRAIYDSIHEAIFIHDIDTGAILSTNRRTRELYGMGEAELLAARIQDLSEGVFPYTQAEAALWMMKAAAGDPQTFEWHARDKSGRLFWVEVTLRRARIGERDCLLAVEHDITHRKAQDEELRENFNRQVQLNQKLEEAHNQLLQSEKMASIGQLAAGVAHELNNPIGFVHSNLGSLEKYLQDIFEVAAAYEEVEKAATGCSCVALDHVRQLKRDKDYEFLREDIFQLMAESKDGLVRVRKIVQDLKDFSRVGDMNWQWANIHQGIDSTLNIVWNELKYKCKVVKEYGNLPEVYCLPSQLNQVFMNLLVNAGHAIEEKGQITLRTGRGNEGSGEVWISVSDTGKGIPKEILTRIFDPFFTTKPVGKGTGLGLSLSYGIIQKHQGRIEVESEVGVGTTFKVTIPVRPASAPEEGKTA